jgi:hypothetical protein
MCPADTSPEAWDIYLSLQRKLTPSERMQQVFEWSDVIRELGMAGLRQQYPDADEREIFLRATRNNLGTELFLKVYGDVIPADVPARKVA